jgi:hypothetical protein
VAESISDYTWKITKRSNNFTEYRDVSYGLPGKYEKNLHKAVFATFTKAEWFFEDGNYSVDHINRDRNDARFVNLRAVTTKENNRNRRL